VPVDVISLYDYKGNMPISQNVEKLSTLQNICGVEKKSLKILKG
jgi:hypothetical protein